MTLHRNPWDCLELLSPRRSMTHSHFNASCPECTVFSHLRCSPLPYLIWICVWKYHEHIHKTLFALHLHNTKWLTFKTAEMTKTRIASYKSTISSSSRSNLKLHLKINIDLLWFFWSALLIQLEILTGLFEVVFKYLDALYWGRQGYHVCYL